MRELDPLAFRDHLKKTLARYIATAVPISEQRVPNLAEAFRKALSEEAELVKGPFLESLPDFVKGATLGALVKEGVLHEGWCALERTGHEALLERRLHTHQETAIRRAREGENYLVATGTGKTECFLYPLIDSLLRDGDLERPGVRAILVYPLNALANDQLYFRIARLILRELGDPGITFGRYTGQVTSRATRATEEARILENRALVDALDLDGKVPENWRLSRPEMLERPPHILITNYAMLEHILLLPRNAPLLVGAALQRLVLDEVHTYTGAQAIEVAFLLRKLKTRLGIERGALQCVGTSASLNEARPDDLEQFAEDLFGEPFSRAAKGEGGSVISGKREIHRELREEADLFSLSEKQWIDAGEIAQKLRDHDSPDRSRVADWGGLCRESGLYSLCLAEDGQSLGSALVTYFSRNAEIRAFARLFEGQSLILFEEVADKLFPNVEPHVAGKALRALISVAVKARVDSGAFPLLPARYHLAASSIEGGVVRLDADEPELWSDFKPKRSHKDAEQVPYYPLLVCRNCSEPYIEGWSVGKHLSPKPAKGAKAERVVLRLTPAAGATSAIEYEPEEDDAKSPDDEAETLTFLPHSGAIVDNEDTPGTLTLPCAEIKEDEEEKKRYVRRCSACGQRTARYPEPVTRLHPGDEALASVVAQALLEALPAELDSQDLPMNGRRLLSLLRQSTRCRLFRDV